MRCIPVNANFPDALVNSLSVKVISLSVSRQIIIPPHTRVIYIYTLLGILAGYLPV
jgi:hypothetical protein